MNPNEKPNYSVSYKYTSDGWVQLTPEALAALYDTKRAIQEENVKCQEYYIELAVEASGMKDANEVLKHIMSK